MAPPSWDGIIQAVVMVVVVFIAYWLSARREDRIIKQQEKREDRVIERQEKFEKNVRYEFLYRTQYESEKKRLRDEKRALELLLRAVKKCAALENSKTDFMRAWEANKDRLPFDEEGKLEHSGENFYSCSWSKKEGQLKPEIVEKREDFETNAKWMLEDINKKLQELESKFEEQMSIIEVG